MPDKVNITVTSPGTSSLFSWISCVKKATMPYMVQFRYFRFVLLTKMDKEKVEWCLYCLPFF